MRNEQPESERIQRMLLHFESELPDHDWGTPEVRVKVSLTVTVQEADPDDRVARSGDGRVHTSILGKVQCRRCGTVMEGDVPWRGDPEEAKESPDKAEAELWKSLNSLSFRHARKRVPRCWGDVPELPQQPSAIGQG